MDSCGLSPEIAISASEKVHFETPDRPESVLNLLRNHGFSKTHISNIIRIRPAILLTNPEKTLLPKLVFFKSIGVSTHDIAKNPILLGRSLENQIIPSYNFLKRMLLSDEEVAAALKRARWFFIQDHSRNVNLVPNIDLLRELGVPESCISSLLTHYQEAVIQRHDQFIEAVNEIKKMGFDPMKLTFVIALHIIGKRSNSTWDRCCRVYTRWGWSKDEILLAFRKHPQCMTYSEKKIMNIMDYLVKKMGWPSGVIARCPLVLNFSLEKRIIPRCSVIQVLSLKGLVKKELSLSTMLVPTEKCFLTTFVTPYLAELPQLLSVYQGKIGALEL